MPKFGPMKNKTQNKSERKFMLMFFLFGFGFVFERLSKFAICHYKLHMHNIKMVVGAVNELKPF